MIKLYKSQPNGAIAYHEAWVNDAEVVEHWGILGTIGKTRSHVFDDQIDKLSNIERFLSRARENGFKEIDIEDHQGLLIEYVIDGWGTSADLDKRHALQDRMDHVLGWTGLGHCDGGSIGSGTMEVFCYVVNFPIAKSVVESDLAGTKFSDYSRIDEESA